MLLLVALHLAEGLIHLLPHVVKFSQVLLRPFVDRFLLRFHGRLSLEQRDVLVGEGLVTPFEGLQLRLHRFDVELQLLLEPDVAANLTLELLQHSLVGMRRVLAARLVGL